MNFDTIIFIIINPSVEIVICRVYIFLNINCVLLLDIY